MILLNANQIKDWDAYTISHQQISSKELMDRAAKACVNYIYPLKFNHIHIFCGPGNNGGDGLAMALIITNLNVECTIYIIENELTKCSNDFQTQFELVKQNKDIKIIDVSNQEYKYTIHKSDLIVDALFGYGLNRPIDGKAKQLVEFLNSIDVYKISIDIPSGIQAGLNTFSKIDTVFKADITLTFQIPKLSLLMSDSGMYAGKLHLLNIGLEPGFLQTLSSEYNFITASDIKPIIKKRPVFSHKGNNGNALLIAGSNNKGGAALMASEACLRIGAGLLTVKLPEKFHTSLLERLPEAMISNDDMKLDFYKAIAIGPGIENTNENNEFLNQLMNQKNIPVVIDADGINILAESNLLDSTNIHPNILLTPHVKEFERLIGGIASSSSERLAQQIAFSKKHQCYIILKGAYSSLSTPEGNVFFNSTGNPGMAKGGSGDVLTGILLGLLSQGYSVKDAALCGMYIHGKSADIAASELHELYILPTDTIHYIYKSLQELS
jgi:hydroxyethylthiazole kinase-like uncharacterized protein yjeF